MIHLPALMELSRERSRTATGWPTPFFSLSIQIRMANGGKSLAISSAF